MYQYDAFDQAIVDQRVDEFRDQTKRYLNGELNEDQFKPLRLMNGLYIQTHAPMLRVAVPYGLLSSRQMRMLAHIARQYDKGYGHFTTRQNIQYNWPQLEQVPDILAELASVQMHAIQTSGNCIRNVTSDHLAGVANDELEDPRPYCEIIRQWSSLHPEFAFLPRKFKIAVSGAARDRAATQVHDIGLYLVKNLAGEIGFQVLVGGGLGRTPIIGKVIHDFLPKQHLLSYLEAILRVYNLHGRRDNKYKARIKILVKALGIDAFRDQVDQEWRRIKDDGLLLEDAEIQSFRDHFLPHEYQDVNNTSAGLEQLVKQNSRFGQWLKFNVHEHRQSGYRVVFVSLKAPEIPPGDITDDQMDLVADIADTYSFSEIRSTHDQNLILAHVRESDLFAVWQKLDQANLAWPNIGTLTDMICCPGLDFCSLANAGSIDIAKQINETFDRLDFIHDLGDIRIKMSGCMNACGHHHVGHIGILGVDKKGEEWYQITLGGSVENEAALGDRLGPAIAKDKVAETVRLLIDVYLHQRSSADESFLQTYRRVGLEPFKNRVYGTT